MLFVMTAVLATLGPPEPQAQESRLSSRKIVMGNTDPDGRTNGELADVGWKTVRGFQWKLYAKNAADKFVPVPFDKEFVTDQRFRIEVEATNDLYFYILNRDSTNTLTSVFPEKEGQQILIHKGKSLMIPEDKTKAFYFTKPPGKETFYIIASPTPLKQLNPEELVRVERGESLGPTARDRAERQKMEREQFLKDLEQSRARMEILYKSMEDTIKLAKSGHRLGTRETFVAPSGEEGVPGRSIFHASPEAENKEPILDEVDLTHRARPG